ncbi:TIGR03618 family F420-dependent PPOX class oxidoreductase [Luedemannella flava]|uniref:TIGR03618 family F420-dependent PPOX class oxidoreductase n=1 Tax=Luedemannella flava TaxID=349316 RepID=A0ABP4YUE9_9ACTN
MDIDQARDFLREHHRAVLATRRPDGRTQLSPVLVGIDGDGDAVISTRETAAKTHYVRRDPRVSLCVTTDAFFGQWVQVDGEATVVSLPEAMEPLVRYYRDLSGEHPDWDDYRAAMVRDRRVVIKIRLSWAGPDRHG